MISILVPTKNRPLQLIQLLKSIEGAGTNHNIEVIVVATGIDIQEIIESFKSQMKLKYIYSNRGGQAHQKMLGLKALDTKCKWVIFCDDDLKFLNGFFETFNDVSESYPRAIGFGVNLSVENRIANRNLLIKACTKLAGLNSNKLGQVLKNGHAVNYMNSKNPLKTQWLSGASIWKSDIALKYKSDFPFSKYAAYEDVIFSYSMNNLGEMVFEPRLKLSFQEQQPDDVTQLEVFLSANCWRFYFVSINKELSFTYMMWTQLFRNLFFVYNNGCEYFLRVYKLWLEMALISRYKNQPLELVKKYCKEVV